MDLGGGGNPILFSSIILYVESFWRVGECLLSKLHQNFHESFSACPLNNHQVSSESDQFGGLMNKMLCTFLYCFLGRGKIHAFSWGKNGKEEDQVQQNSLKRDRTSKPKEPVQKQGIPAELQDNVTSLT